MSDARFWYLPLKDVAPEEQRAHVAACDEVAKGMFRGFVDYLCGSG